MSDENMRMMCEHEKEYTEGTILTSFPAKKSWICKKCGKKGYDIEGWNVHSVIHVKSELGNNSYVLPKKEFLIPHNHSFCYNTITEVYEIINTDDIDRSKHVVFIVVHVGKLLVSVLGDKEHYLTVFDL